MTNLNTNNKTTRPPSKGELYLENYLDESNIKYEPEYRINDLKGDDRKSFRIADFYLPRLGFFVEYYGLYNKSDKHKFEYDYKSNLYIKNRKPTIFLYPEDLGILDYSFHSEIKRLFRYKIYHNKWFYLRYSLNRYFVKGKPLFLLGALYFYTLGVIFTGLDLSINEGFRNILGYSSYVVALVLLWKFIRDFLNHVHLSEILGYINWEHSNN